MNLYLKYDDEDLAYADGRTNKVEYLSRNAAENTSLYEYLFCVGIFNYHIELK